MEQYSSNAESKYKGDCVEALTQLVKDQENTFRERNRAIWALGQLGDKRALSVLEELYTGNIWERESYDDCIS